MNSKKKIVTIAVIMLMVIASIVGTIAVIEKSKNNKYFHTSLLKQYYPRQQNYIP